MRPLLVDRCYQCHSTKSEKIKGNLLLDSPEGWLKGGDAGPAVVPGDVTKSLLVDAIQYKHQEMEMPPKGKLPDAEIGILVEWVRMGAPAPDEVKNIGKGRTIDITAGRKFWSYQPIADVAVPTVKNTRWPKNAIDQFVLASLESKGIAPVADADAATLCRRLYFDLIGLPPTPEQLQTFTSDKSADRYENLVDALLSSPAFGERFGRHWLDIARFGESLTLRGFVLKDAWRYRDYVIDAFNQDMPFDQFMREQIAGDLLPAATDVDRRRQVIATAFLAVGNTNLEEQDKKQLEMDVVDDQIDTLGRAFLAQTIGCARCHDHKFDPIATADYYALAGILHSTTTLEHSNVSKWLEMPLPVPADQEQKLASHAAVIAVLEGRIKQLKSQQTKTNKAAGLAVDLESLPGIVIDDQQAKRVGDWKVSKAVRPFIGDGYLTDAGDRQEIKTLTFAPEIPANARYEVRFAYTEGNNRASNVPVTVFSADGEKTILIDETVEPPIDGHFISLGQYTFEKNGQSFVIISNEKVNGHVIADAVQFLPLDGPGIAAGAAPVTTKPATQVAQPDLKATAKSEELKQLEAELKKLVESGPKRDTVISIRESKEIANARIHIRGSVYTLGVETPRGFLSVIPVSNVRKIPVSESGRRELGQWLSSPENPLPARVAVNRMWHWLTGSGIVRTTDNFGTTGEAPSHPELLDYLAKTFVENKWSVKSLVRQIVLSHTYRLSTTSMATQAQADPENRLFWRMNRRRLDAECLRDSMLAVSGQLSLAHGGITYKPELKSDYGFKQADNRRSVYLPAFRNALPEMFEAFDFADPSMGTGRRNTSTVAPQALFMMNHPFVSEQSAFAANLLLADKNLVDDDSKVIRAYQLVTGRIPTVGEKKVAMNFLSHSTSDRSTAWTQLFHALFASVDFRYVE